jgi:YVTN family beta-propeller protein
VTIPVGNVPERVAVSPDGHIAYVTNKVTTFAGAVRVVDTGSGTVTATIPVGVHPERVVVHADGVPRLRHQHRLQRGVGDRHR